LCNHLCTPALPGGFTLVLRGCIAGFSWNMISEFQKIIIYRTNDWRLDCANQ
jgi:hypothetical protein